MPSAPSWKTPLVNISFQMSIASTRPASVQSPPSMAAQNLPGATLLAIAWKTSWETQPSLAPMLMHCAPLAATCAQNSASWAGVT